MKMYKPLTIFLSGAVKNQEDEGKGWRKSAIEKIKTTADWADQIVEIVDPTDYFSYSEKRHMHDKQVMDYYFWRIENSDIVLVNLNDSEGSCGTCMELAHAADHRIPIIGFGESKVYNWTIPLLQAHFPNITEAIDYLRDFYFR